LPNDFENAIAAAMTHAAPQPDAARRATRQTLLARLASLGIATTTREHAPVFTVDEARRLRGEIAGAHCKNLFLKDKKGLLWLIVCLEDTRIDLKALPDALGSGRLSFAKAELLRERLGVDPGSVTPFAAINAPPGSVKLILEKAMMDHDIVNLHPLENCATTSIAPADLVKFLRSCGHEPQMLPLP
jgi:Ala-tRNA(Pro) deacylase